MGASTRRPSAVVLIGLVVLWCCCGSSGFAPPPSSVAALVRAAGVPHRGGTPSMSQAAAAAAGAADTETTMKSVRRSWRRGKRENFKRAVGRSSLNASDIRDKWGTGVWEKFKVRPDGRAHDEVTFRSGCEGRTLTIPQGVWFQLFRFVVFACLLMPPLVAPLPPALAVAFLRGFRPLGTENRRAIIFISLSLSLCLCKRATHPLVLPTAGLRAIYIFL